MTAHPLDALPAFADDRTIGAAILGKKRAGEWCALTPLLEDRGLPKIDPLHGGRYVPAVKAFYQHGAGLIDIKPSAPDGVEDLSQWKTKRQKRRA